MFLLDLAQAARRDGWVGKTLLLDLLAIPEPNGVGGDGDFFSVPVCTIESVHVVDERTLLIASDNGFPFSSGRVRTRGEIKFRGLRVFLSESLAGELVGLEPVDDGLWSVIFNTTLLARYDERNQRIYG